MFFKRFKVTKCHGLRKYINVNLTLMVHMFHSPKVILFKVRLDINVDTSHSRDLNFDSSYCEITTISLNLTFGKVKYPRFESN